MPNFKFAQIMRVNFFVLVCLVFTLFCSCQKNPIEQEGLQREGVVTLSKQESALLLEKTATTETNKTQSTLINIPLDNGNELQFFELETTTDNNEFLVLESHECTDCSALSTIGDKMGADNYNAHDIFWAFSKPGTPIPNKLVSQERSLLKATNQQGWALTEMESEATSRGYNIACNNSSFRTIPGGFLDGATLIRYDKTPRSSSIFTTDCFDFANDGRCWGGSRYKYKATFNNINKWIGKACVKAVQANYNDHYVEWCGSSCSANPSCTNYRSCKTYVGPEIRFQRYVNGSWYTLQDGHKTASYEASANRTHSYTWWASSSQRRSFRIDVRYAKNYDEFDFLISGEN